MNIRKEIQDLLPELERVRRALHEIPELGFQEEKTSNYIYDYLQALKPDQLVRIAGTGVKAVFEAKNPQRVTAFRADMDALPITEATGLPFASQHEGKMHACGHDTHMATNLLLAKLVAEHRDSLTETVVVFFQPSEEANRGAVRMVEEGVLDNPKVDRIFGFHVWPDYPAGKFATRKGALMAHNSTIDLVIRGKSAHGGTPHLGNDAIVAAAHLVCMIQSIISRRIDPMDQAAFTIGTINGGLMRNIVCEEVRMKCTLRCFSDAAYNTIINGIDDMMKGLETSFGVTTAVEHECGDYHTVVNDEAMVDTFVAAVGEDMVLEASKTATSEDFSFYQEQVPGAFVFLGIGKDGGALHTPCMFFTEEKLLPMLEAYMRLLGM